MGAVGTDTGGSIRIPSSVNGTTGLKPTFGRVSRRGITPLSWSLDHAGPMARTVADVALLLQALAGYDPSDPGTVDAPVPTYTGSLGGDVTGQTLAVATNWFFDRIEPDVEAAFRAAVATLESAGSTIREVTLPLTEAYVAVEYALFTAEASSYHQATLRIKADLFEPDVRALLGAGELIYATDYIRALRARELIRQGWREMFESNGIDALLAPTLPAVAVRADDPLRALAGRHHRVRDRRLHPHLRAGQSHGPGGPLGALRLRLTRTAHRYADHRPTVR